MKHRAAAYLVIAFILSALPGFAGEKYWVTFKDKAGVTFNPYQYFDQRTIEQRNAHGIPLNDSSDFPVNETYIKTVQSIADSVSFSSRWLNGIAVYASPGEIEEIKKLLAVARVEPMQRVVV